MFKTTLYQLMLKQLLKLKIIYDFCYKGPYEHYFYCYMCHSKSDSNK